MSETKNYYYIKLKDNYFDQDNIKILESMKNGHTYSLIIIKLYLKSSKYDGRLMMTSSIPYDPSRVEILASVIGHDVAHVKEAIKIARELDLITIVDGREIWMTEIQNFIGSSSTEADRKRDYRKRIESNLPVVLGHLSGQKSDVRPPEKEIEKELDKKIEIKKKRKQASLDFSILDKLEPKYKELLLQYIQSRKDIKKPMTQLALQKALTQLNKFSMDERITAIENAIIGGWTGLYPQKKKDQYGKPIPPKQTPMKVDSRPTHCDKCGNPMTTNFCSCGRQLFSVNGVYSFEDGASDELKQKFNEAMIKTVGSKV